MAVDRFFTPSVVVKNISNKAVRLIGRVTIKPGEIIDLYEALQVSVELFEDQIIKGLEKPHGDLYRESQVKKTIVILTLNLTSSYYSIVGPSNINSTNNYAPGLVPSAVSDEQFEWVSSAGILVNPPLVLTGNTVSIPPANASQDGYLTKEDWSRFNASVKGALRIWQYQDFAAPVSNSVTLSAFENGSGLAFNASYILDSTAEVVLSSDTSQPPTTTTTIPAVYLPGNRVSVSSHIGTTVVFNNTPDSSQNVRVFYLVSVPANVPLPNDYQEDPEFLNDASLDYLDDLYVNQNANESIYGDKTFEGNVIFNSGLRYTATPVDGYYLRTDALGNASWAPVTGGGTGDVTNATNIGTDGYGVFAQKSGSILEFKNIASGSGRVIVDQVGDNITIDVSPDAILSNVDLDGYFALDQNEIITGLPTFVQGFRYPDGANDGYVLTSDADGYASWRDNTRAVNVGADGYGVFKQRVNRDLLEFKNVDVGSNNLTINEFLDTITVDVDVDNLRVAISGPENEPTGFPNRTDSAISFDDGTRTLTVSPTGASFEVYTNARRRIYFSDQTVTIPDQEGLWFIYFDDSGVLTAVSGFTLDIITKFAYVALIYWDATNNRAIYIGEERHGITMDGITHAYLHQYNGTIYLNGLGLTGLTVDGPGSGEDEARWGVSNGLIYDEDIDLPIVDGSPQDLTPFANVPVFYRDGPDGYWRSKDPDGYNLIYSGTAGYTGASGRPPYNEYTGTTWQLTEVTNNGFFFVHVIATNDINYPIITIQGISEYTNISDARDNAAIELGTLTGLPFAEFVTIGTVIYQTANSYTNVPKVRVRSTDTGDDYVDWRDVRQISGNGANDHGLLVGLSDDDHSQYALLTGSAIRNAISGKFDFSAGELRLPVSADPDTSYPSAVVGDIAFDTTDGYVVYYDGASWVAVGSGGGGGSGDVTNAANIGTDGYGFFAQKSGSILEFKNLAPGTDNLTISSDGYNVYISLVTSALANDLGLDGYASLDGYNIYTGTNIFDPSVSTDPALTIVPDGAAPTTNVYDGSVSIIGGIQYNYDGTRGKWLSNERKFLVSGFDSNNTTNLYINVISSVASSATGYRLLRDGTLTGIWAQTQDVETWTFEIRRNGAITAIASLGITAARGGSNSSLNVDVNADDEIQFYVNGTKISRPVVGIEIAWRI